MKKVLVSAVAAASIVTGAFAEIDGSNDAVAMVSNDGTGDYLVAPAFVAESGVKTHLKVINTNPSYGYCIRAVVRDYEASNERDFGIVLSPSDVWSGTIDTDASGNSQITSTDPSTYKDVFETAYPLADSYDGVSREFKKGYVEFFVLTEVDFGTQYPTEHAKIDKDDMEAYCQIFFENTNPTVTGDVVAYREAGDDSISGYVTMEVTDNSALMKLPMLAVENAIEDSVSGFGLAGENYAPPKDTAWVDLVKEDEVYEALHYYSTTFDYTNSAAYSALYLAFVGDSYGEDVTGCSQQRTFNFWVRDEDENRPAEEEGGYVSGGTTITPTQTINCEMNIVAAQTVLAGLQYEAGIGTVYSFNHLINGVKYSNQTDTHNSQYASFVPTMVSADFVNDNPSYSWTYLPTTRWIGRADTSDDLFNADSSVDGDD